MREFSIDDKDFSKIFLFLIHLRDKNYDNIL